MNCEAPRHPEGCTGSVEAIEGVPLCEAHRVALGALTGPWRTPAGAKAWLAAMADVVKARTSLGVATVGDRPEEPSGAKEHHAPWVNWNDGSARRGLAWVGGSPGWDSSDGRNRVVNSLVKKPAKKKRPKVESAKNTEKDGKNTRKFWHWNKFAKKKGKGSV